jgi:hypothetical protein
VKSFHRKKCHLAQFFMAFAMNEYARAKALGGAVRNRIEMRSEGQRQAADRAVQVEGGAPSVGLIFRATGRRRMLAIAEFIARGEPTSSKLI